MSYRLKSRTQSPPNGFLYRQALTGWQNWSVCEPSKWDFGLLCKELQKHRLSNPKYRLNTNLTAIENEVDRVNAERVAALPNSESYVVSDAAPASFRVAPAASLLRQVAAVGANLKAGKDILFDWEESGKPPVAQGVANKRAETCVQCPCNGKGDLSRYFTLPAAALIKSSLERLHQMNLKTPSDSMLGTCEACTCPLRLKIWTPIEFIKEHTSEDVMAKLDPKCWVLAEFKHENLQA